MRVGKVIHEVRQSLTVIRSTQEQATVRIIKEVEKIDALIARLDLELTCPMEKDCPRLEEGKRRNG